MILLNGVIEMDKSALVLSGGGHFAIAWQIGYLKGLADCGVELRDVKEIVGTSAGAQVGALITSDLHWNIIWEEQIEQSFDETSPVSDDHMEALYRQINQIAYRVPSNEAWMQEMSDLSRNTKAVIPQSERFEMIAKRLGSAADENWPETLNIVATELETNERKMFTYSDDVNLIKALAASAALQGVWPSVEIEGKHYYDGGSYSMDNADLVTDAETVVILATALPVETPFSLRESVEALENRGQRVRVVKPSREVMKILEKYHFNTTNPDIRPEIAQAAKQQGYNDVDAMYTFWK